MSKHAGRVGQNHPQQVKARGALDSVDDRSTRWVDFEPISARFGFTIDVAASPENAKCRKYFTRETNGLEQSWAGEIVWCNPPFSDLASWIRKAWAEHGGCPAIAMLLPADRTEQPFWQQLVEPYRDRPGSPLRVEFLPGRREFLRPGATAAHRGERSPFGVVLLVWQAVGWVPGAVPAGGLFS